MRLNWFKKVALINLEAGLGLSKAQCSRILAKWSAQYSFSSKHRYKRAITLDNISTNASPRLSDSGVDLMNFMESQHVIKSLIPSSTSWFYDIDFKKVDLDVPVIIERELMSDILVSLSERQQLEIFYRSRDDSRIRLITPTLLFSFLGSYYLRAYDFDSTGFRNFKISRISSTKLSSMRKQRISHDADSVSALLQFRLNPELPQKIRIRLGEEYDIGVDGVLNINSRKYFHELIKLKFLEEKMINLNGIPELAPYWVLVD